MHAKIREVAMKINAWGRTGTGSQRTARRILVAIVGATVFLLGIALLVLPGPAFIVIPIGLAILATEFVWAKRWLHKLKGMVARKSGESKRNPVA